MTVPSATSDVTYDGNGSTQDFSVPFYFLDDTHLVVQTITNGVATTKTLDTDYTVSGAGNEAGGDITMLSAPAVGTNVYIYRQVPLTQLKAYVENTPFPAATQEQALDQLTMAAQQLYLAIQGALRLSAVSTIDGVSGVLPEPVANEALGWNATADGLQNISIPDAGTGTYVPGFTGAVASRLVADKLREFVSVLDFGADDTGVADSTTAFNDAFAVCANVYVPPGTYTILDAVNVPKSGRIWGVRHSVTINMGSTFNASALGGFVFTHGEPGPELRGITFTQVQPDSTTPTVYPPCVYAQATPRFKISECRFQCVYDAIDMKGNSGGAVIDDVELSPLNIGIDIDGSLDSIKASRLHLWPFGLTTNQRTAYTAAYGIKVARADDFKLSNSILFAMPNALYAYSSTNGDVLGSVTGCDFDSAGGLTLVAGKLMVSDSLFTLSTYTSTQINQQGGILNVSNCYLRTDASPGGSPLGSVVATGGQLTMTGCWLGNLGDWLPLVFVNTATAVISGCTISRPVNTALSAPDIRFSTGGKGVVSGCHFIALGTGSAKAVMIDADTGVTVAGNNLNGHTVSPAFSGAFTNTRISNNLGATGEKEDFSGYFSSDATTTTKLPSGWTISKLTTGNYSVTHNLGLSSVNDMIYFATADNSVTGAMASIDMSASDTNHLRIRTYVGTTPTDCGASFRMRRFRA